jgi:hypothetical protein
LFSAIEAAVLYGGDLYTLPARLDMDDERLGLRERLLEAGALRELDLADDHQHAAEAEGCCKRIVPCCTRSEEQRFDGKPYRQS